jgi:DtxR family transcriptional regulator, Mn-dependent transcriptional regulator
MGNPKKLSASLEDYLEAIYLICRERGEARSKEIMEHLRVTGPSVTEAFQLLADKGLINYSPYEAITLTNSGRAIAGEVLRRHEALRGFFIEVLQVDWKTADLGACQMEHVASPNIIERMIRYTQYMREQCHSKSRERRLCFAEYLQGKQPELFDNE